MFTNIPNGLEGVETRLPLLYKGKLVEVACANPARLYGLENKDSIAPGYDAHVVVWYKDEGFAAFELPNEMLNHSIDYIPYAGMRFGNWPRCTVVRGSVVWVRDEGVLWGEDVWEFRAQEEGWAEAATGQV
ncbi:Dihydropyrimidinase [Lachnellula suecica]|uniref:dihydropyrimidinase n=1 Tax=Lachnellula suecica TaxID=602035 RepID=A0A8T9C1Y1_9HELO|nr:Dihydropyrimidinase [Lachnellula suecica]